MNPIPFCITRLSVFPRRLFFQYVRYFSFQPLGVLVAGHGFPPATRRRGDRRRERRAEVTRISSLTTTRPACRYAAGRIRWSGINCRTSSVATVILWQMVMRSSLLHTT
jgi:hypothetical protein